MKKMILFGILTVPLMAGIIFTGYWSSTHKPKDAWTNIMHADRDLIAAQEDENEAEQKAATAEEWMTFRHESELKIRGNEIRIAELNLKLNTPGERTDTNYGKKSAILELQNKDLKARLDAYEKIQSNWGTFKLEFNRDMDVVEAGLKELPAAYVNK